MLTAAIRLVALISPAQWLMCGGIRGLIGPKLFRALLFFFGLLRG